MKRCTSVFDFGLGTNIPCVPLTEKSSVVRSMQNTSMTEHKTVLFSLSRFANIYVLGCPGCHPHQ
ncbi:hypothetical protein T265_05381 [Opisthorchis viverrini]|uniref:Uncharacterized protein n=1 Tax=Opisthorchis viverrini TaxID=6198 RepID=A0A074ZJP1_OPIVI|nr:hypothetical protein T265_05381 [Opisthorchis viverrini]KER27563.1 hypothetical protein T265_05381 [Opisthorchis viverrini]